MNAQSPSGSIAQVLINYRFRLPLYALGGRIFDADGDFVTMANPARGAADAQQDALAFVRLVNTAVASAAPVPAEVGFASAEA